VCDIEVRTIAKMEYTVKTAERLNGVRNAGKIKLVVQNSSHTYYISDFPKASINRGEMGPPTKAGTWRRQKLHGS
jgi:hypothetical protein